MSGSINPLTVKRNQTTASAYIHIAVNTPTAIVIIRTLMLMVLKRIRLWISAIIFILRGAITIRQIKNPDAFLLFLRERDSSMQPIRSKSKWGQWISKTTYKAGQTKIWATLGAIAKWAQKETARPKQSLKQTSTQDENQCELRFKTKHPSLNPLHAYAEALDPSKLDLSTHGQTSF